MRRKCFAYKPISNCSKVLTSLASPRCKSLGPTSLTLAADKAYQPTMQPRKPSASKKLSLLVLGLLIAGRFTSCHEDNSPCNRTGGSTASGVPAYVAGEVSKSTAAAVVPVEPAAQHRVASKSLKNTDVHAMQEAHNRQHRPQHRQHNDCDAGSSSSSSRKESRHRQQHAARLQSHRVQGNAQGVNTDRHYKVDSSSSGARAKIHGSDRHRQHVSAHTMHRAAVGRQSDDQQQQIEQPTTHNHPSTKHSRHRQHSTAQHQHASIQHSTSAQPGSIDLLRDPLADSSLLQWLTANGAVNSVDLLVGTPEHLPTKAAAPAAKAKARSAKAKLQSAEAVAAATAAAYEEGQRLARLAELQKLHWQLKPSDHASRDSSSSSDSNSKHEPKQLTSHDSKQAAAGYAARPQSHSPGASTATADLVQTAVVHRRSMQQMPACRQGQVSQIRCWLDADGYITALAVESEHGITTPAVCAATGLQADGGSLREGEGIVEIVSCRSASGGVSYMEFHTDRLRKHPITCGSGMPLRADAPLSENTAVECESLSQAQVFSEPVARQVSVASILATRRQHKPADVPSPQDAYPIQGLRASCNARQQLAAFRNMCWTDSTDSSKQPKLDKS